MATVVRRSVRLPVGGRRPLRSQEAKANPRAFADLYQRHHQALHRYCRSILHHEEDARDALQSALTRALAALATEEREFDVKPWLFRIAHNEAVSMLRRRREVGELAPLAVAPPGPERRMAEREELAQLRADLDDLPERQRAALVLRELSGLSHAEIGSALDMNERTVKQAIFEARQALLACRDGRELECSAVQRTLSDGDRRTLRGRRLRAHLRSCAACGAFRAQLEQRPRELAALAPPLPAAAGAVLLAQILGGGGAAGGAAAGAGAGALATKLATGALVVTTAGSGYVATHEIVADPAKPRSATRASDAAPRSAPPVAAAAGARRAGSARAGVSGAPLGGGGNGRVAAGDGPGTARSGASAAIARVEPSRADQPRGAEPDRTDADRSPRAGDDKSDRHDSDHGRDRRGDRSDRRDSDRDRRGDGPGRHGSDRGRGRHEDGSDRDRSIPERRANREAPAGAPDSGHSEVPDGDGSPSADTDRPPDRGHDQSPPSGADRSPSPDAKGSPDDGPQRSGSERRADRDRPARPDGDRRPPRRSEQPGTGPAPVRGGNRPGRPGRGRRDSPGAERPTTPDGDSSSPKPRDDGPSQRRGDRPGGGGDEPPKPDDG